MDVMENGSSERETVEMVSLRTQPSRTDDSVKEEATDGEATAESLSEGPFKDVVFQADIRRLRRYLMLYFHPAFKVTGNKCTIHVFYCLLFVVQIAKLTLITVQMFKFGQERGHFSSAVYRGETTLRHLLLEGWDASWETLPYPPAHGDFAVYDVKNIIHKINFAVERYYNLEIDAIGHYTIMPDDEVNIVMQFFDFVGCENGSLKGQTLSLCEISFEPGKGLSSHKDKATNNTIYSYDIMKEFAYHNLSHPIKKLLQLTVKFSIHSARIYELDKEALCMSVKGEISFSDRDNNGQVLVQLLTVSSKVACSKLNLDIPDWSLQRSSLGLGKAVIVTCCIGLVITLIVFAFAIFVFVQTKLFMRKYYHAYFQPEDPEETDLPTREYLRFIIIWDMCTAMADCLTLYGTIQIVFKNERREINLVELDMFTIWLAVGCFFAWINVLRFVKFYTKFKLLFSTLYRAVGDVLAYLVCVAVLFAGYFVVGYVVLGPYNIKFSTPDKAFETLAALVNGDEIFTTLGITDQEAGSYIYWFSRTFLWSYISAFTIVILNLLVALFMSAYECVKDIQGKKEDDTRVSPVEEALRHVLDNHVTTSFRKSLCDLMSTTQWFQSLEEQALHRELSKLCRMSGAGNDIILIRYGNLRFRMSLVCVTSNQTAEKDASRRAADV